MLLRSTQYTDGGLDILKKEYIEPELDIVKLSFGNLCGDVVHTSFEEGGHNSGWGFDDDDDDDNFGDLP